MELRPLNKKVKHQMEGITNHHPVSSTLREQPGSEMTPMIFNQLGFDGCKIRLICKAK